MHSTGRVLAVTRMRKQLWIVRHGQAAHNPRAEAAKEAGCSHDEFLEHMRLDDVLDAPTTELGKEQARELRALHSWSHLELIVSSPLSRALETADIVVPPSETTRRVCIEDFREVNGWLLNAKRRDRSVLESTFPAWDFGNIAERDELWTTELEEQVDCAHRGFSGLRWLLNRPEDNILLVCHGGILRFMMNLIPDHVRVVDGRTCGNTDRDAKARFGNCELRRYELRSYLTDDTSEVKGSNKYAVTLTEIDL